MQCPLRGPVHPFSTRLSPLTLTPSPSEAQASSTANCRVGVCCSSAILDPNHSASFAPKDQSRPSKHLDPGVSLWPCADTAGGWTPGSSALPTQSPFTTRLPSPSHTCVHTHSLLQQVSCITPKPQVLHLPASNGLVPASLKVTGTLGLLVDLALPLPPPRPSTHPLVGQVQCLAVFLLAGSQGPRSAAGTHPVLLAKRPLHLQPSKGAGLLPKGPILVHKATSHRYPSQTHGILQTSSRSSLPSRLHAPSATPVTPMHRASPELPLHLTFLTAS